MMRCFHKPEVTYFSIKQLCKNQIFDNEGTNNIKSLSIGK